MTQAATTSKSLALLVLMGMASFALGLFSADTTATETTNGMVLRGEGYTDPIPSVGPLDSPVMVVEVADYNCVWCGLGLPGRAHGKAPFVKRLLAEHDDVLFVFKHFLVFRRSVVTRTNSETGSLAALAAQRQGRFWEYHDLLFQHVGETWDEAALTAYAADLGLNTEQFAADIQDPGLLRHVRLDDAAGQAVGVQGTPSMYINGLKVPNIADAGDVRILVREAREEVLSLLQTGQAQTVQEARRIATVQNAGETFARHFHDHYVVGLTVDESPGLPPQLNATLGGE